MVRIMLLVNLLLHLAFAAGEMYPWQRPFILDKVIHQKFKESADEKPFFKSAEKDELVDTIVHNAGIYNVILVLGFLWCLFPNAFGATLDARAAKALCCFFFLSAVIAGLFGVTLSVLTLIQAACGALGLASIALQKT